MLVLRRPDEDTVVGVGLNMLLQVLRTLEGFAAEITLVWLKRNMDTNMRSNVITLHCGGAARVPLASQVEVVGALPADMLLAEMVLLNNISLEHSFDRSLPGIQYSHKASLEC